MHVYDILIVVSNMLTTNPSEDGHLLTKTSKGQLKLQHLSFTLDTVLNILYKLPMWRTRTSKIPYTGGP
jgi:hypothetical protein